MASRFTSLSTPALAGALSIALGAAAATFAFAPSAQACGGLFCNNQQPVNQAAERIIFSDNPDGTVTAVVQILYEGPSEKFAWVLPVPTVPEVELSSNAAFDALQNATNPQYVLNTRVEGQCDNDGPFFGTDDSGSAESLGGRGAQNNAGGVNVLDSGNVGPYDYDVIEVEMGTPEPVQVALDWLDREGYDVSAMGPEVIEPYLEDGMKLLAFRLTKNSDAGDVRPIRITYDADVPMVPIKLTAVAANDDMGVLVWVLGEERAIPVNYKHLELNEAILNWFNPGSNYDAVINLAADEAEGHGFVTEFAGDSDAFSQTIFTGSDAAQWANITGQEWRGQELQLISTVHQSFGQRFDNFGNMIAWDGFSELADAAFPRATQETKELFVECGSCAFSGANGLPEGFDPAAFIEATDDFVVGPMRATQELLDSRPYVTRLYTTLSAREMTVDPAFDFNADLADFDNIHTGERIIECDGSVIQSEAPWRAELPSGLVVRGTGNTWPLMAGEDGMPATALITQEDTEGEGEVVTDNARTIREALDRHNLSVPTAGSGCTTAGGRAEVPGAALLLGLLGLVGLARRRRGA